MGDGDLKGRCHNVMITTYLAHKYEDRKGKKLIFLYTPWEVYISIRVGY